MAYGDLSVFLPRAEGEALNTEQARAEATKKADYLSSMDQFYDSLEETQRQFDLQQELANRQFEWTTGFEEKKLEQEAGFEGERLGIEERRVAYEEEAAEELARYREGLLEVEGGRLGLEQSRLEQDVRLREQELEQQQSQFQSDFSLREEGVGFERERLNLETSEQGFLQWLYSDQQDLARDRFELESEVLRTELEQASTPNNYGTTATNIHGTGQRQPWGKDPLGVSFSVGSKNRRSIGSSYTRPSARYSSNVSRTGLRQPWS